MSYAKRAAIFGHIQSGMGEKSLAIKFKKAIEGAGYEAGSIIDIIEWMGDDYERLAELNYDLAEGDFSMIEEIKSDFSYPSADLNLILSWSWSLAALFAIGIQKKAPTVAKLFVHHTNERVIKRLYEPATLLITESLLANERGMAYGIEGEKILYLPHVYPAEWEGAKKSREYAHRLALAQGKMINPETRIIGCVSRLEYGKNCEFAIEAIRRLVLEGEDIVLILKGDFPQNTPYPEYRDRLSEMLKSYAQESWLLWDKDFTPFAEVYQQYLSFDLLLHPSGAEGGSHVVVEMLGLGIPVILLECSTNPYLFKGVATFVKTTGEIRSALLPFYIPDLDDLCAALKEGGFSPQKERVEERFHEQILEKRIPLLFTGDREKIKSLYQHDRKIYSL